MFFPIHIYIRIYIYMQHVGLQYGDLKLEMGHYDGRTEEALFWNEQPAFPHLENLTTRASSKS